MGSHRNGTSLVDLTGCSSYRVCHSDFTIPVLSPRWRALCKKHKLDPRLFSLGAQDISTASSAFAPRDGSRQAKRFSFDENLRITVDGYTALQCRVNGCLCDSGSTVSLTARSKHDAFGENNPSPKPLSPLAPETARYILPTGPTINTLLRGLGEQPLQGLIVIAGGTSSGKTKLAQPLALQYTLGLRRSGRRLPHLVTFEDPIEPWTVFPAESRRKGRQLSATLASEYGFNFTPREKHKDVDCLVSAISDAKRQTPACLYVGEVRSRLDWRTVIDFAGSGHLVIATTHAGSLVETIGRVLLGADANTPARRGWVARQLLCCVHMAGTTVSFPKKTNTPRKRVQDSTIKRAKFPSVWLRSAGAINELIVDGLASVVPNAVSILSRRQFVERMYHQMTSVARTGTAFENETNAEAIMDAAEAMDFQEL